MSAPGRELTRSQERATARVEAKLVDQMVTDWAVAARERVRNMSKGQLASELIGPRQRGRKVNAKLRRRADRVKRYNPPQQSALVGDELVAIDVKPNDVPLREPRWARRQPREAGPIGEVTRYRQVEGPALPGQPWPVRYRLTSSEETRSQAAERLLRERAYQLSAGDDPDSIKVVRYQESDADHRPRVVGKVDSLTGSAGLGKDASRPDPHRRRAVARDIERAYGETCGGCGLHHRGEC